MNPLNATFIDKMNDSFSLVCEKSDRLELVYGGIDRHAVVEWMARLRAGSLSDPTHVGYVALAAWVDDLNDLVVETWAGVATQTSATRDLVMRSIAGEMPSMEPDEFFMITQQLVDECAHRSERISANSPGLQQEIQFTSERSGDEYEHWFPVMKRGI